MFEDQIEYSKRVSIRNGTQYIRPVVAPRVGSGEERVNFLWNNMIKALTTPLTAAEQEKGRYEPAPPPRVIYEGTLLDAQNFFQQSQPIAACGDCPMAKYTDGLPVIIPTEAAVKAMLAGTSHSPDELIYRYTMNQTSKKVQKAATPLSYSGFQATVEKVAVNAVMSGCKPEYLPVVLAIACSGLGWGTDPIWQQWQVVSGPIAKEIGMNSMVGAMEPGNVANRPIGRTYQMMAINIAGAVVGVNRMNAMGWGGNGAQAFAENDAGLPPGWETLRSEYGYGPKDSMVMCWSAQSNIFVNDTIFGSFYRGFMDRAPDVEWPQGSPAAEVRDKKGIDFVGKPGPHNFLLTVIDDWYDQTWGPKNLFFIPRIADDLYKFGFKSKAQIYQWIWDNSVAPFKERTYLGVRGVVAPTDGYTKKKWADIPMDLPYPRAAGWGGTNVAMDNCIIITGGTYEEWMRLDRSGRGSDYSIDAWK
jgi:hypothetical protein